MITAYYNEFDPKAAAWLRQLIKNGDITPGEVDERSITEVTANDIKGYNRVHFFAGIGTWDYALNQAGWADRRVCTASLPCQPFSIAGKELGKQDERHLLPRFIELVKQCRFATILGEQVPGAIKHGWLDDLYAEMEAYNYAVGSIIIGAHSVGAPHIRQRLYWMADSNNPRSQGRLGVEGADKLPFGESCMVNRLADAKIASWYWGDLRGNKGAFCGEFDWIECRDGKYRPIKPGIQPLVDGSAEKLVRGGDTSTQINADATQEARAMRLKGYGNAIQAQTAELFIRTCKDILI